MWTKRFEVGMTYTCRSACDYDCVYRWTVVKRTDKSIWVSEHDRPPVRRAIKLIEVPHMPAVEQAYPAGRYSMCPVIRADRRDN